MVHAFDGVRASMLSLHKFRPASRPLLRHRAKPTNKRNFIAGLGPEFLDFALALPIPPSWPAYSTGIIVVTLATRFAILPVSIWAKRRSRLIEEVVMPEITKQKPIVADQVFNQMKADKIRGEKPFLIEYHANKCRDILTAHRSALFKKYGCQPWKTMILPPLIQIPPFIVITMVLRQLSQSPTPFDSETFLTLSTLAHPDPTMVLPVILGLVTMANVETSNWLMTTTQRVNMERVEKQREAMRAEGKRILEPGKIIKTALRGLSVFRILIASVMPGGVTLYWVTSAVFGLGQTLVMDWMDFRHRNRIEASKAVASVTAAPRRALPRRAPIAQPADAVIPPAPSEKLPGESTFLASRDDKKSGVRKPLHDICTTDLRTSSEPFLI